MVTVLTVFLLAALVALVVTPPVSAAARRLGVLDRPSERKVHGEPIPRAGGVAIFVAVAVSLGAPFLYGTSLSEHVSWDAPRLAFWLGALLVFGLGLWDDVKRLRPRVKLLIQVGGALVAYLGGARIHGLVLPWGPAWELGWLSLPVTVFWFVLLMNAMNLIDGLDGLAAGVSLFACVVLGTLCVTAGRMVEAFGFAAIAGACLGFLRYNFNPASVFMGDSGAYLLGYLMAGMSILGSLKSQAAVAILIPIVALGVPLMDTMLATVRRFLLGAGVFKADRDHLHHRLVRMGFTHQRAVLVIYGVTVGLGVVSLVLVYLRDFRAGLVLLLLGVIAVLAIRKLGYLEYLAAEKFLGWFQDLSDELGLRRDRRTFLGRQVEIYQSRSMEEMWERVAGTARNLGMDFVELKVWDGEGVLTFRRGAVEGAGLEEGKLRGFDPARAMYISLPLSARGRRLGVMCLAKDISEGPLPRHALRRIEQLRRTVGDTLLKLTGGEGAGPRPAEGGLELPRR
jgi:UDP-GlcNAc:undecaprenyl-phosphate GlcNAc-1-phosphate transferase